MTKVDKLAAEKLIITEAFKAAEAGAQNLIDKNPGIWYPCGFSWVNIRPARGPFVKALKEMNIGHVDSFEGGYTVYNPSGNGTQWMNAKEAGSDAFATVLQKHGVNAVVRSRID